MENKIINGKIYKYFEDIGESTKARRTGYRIGHDEIHGIYQFYLWRGELAKLNQYKEGNMHGVLIWFRYEN